MKNPYGIVRDFEAALCEYTGAPFAVTVNSCTMAILLACAWWRHAVQTAADTYNRERTFVAFPPVHIPRCTYVSVPMSVRHAGFDVVFDFIPWQGLYRLNPLPVWDSARYFSSGMYRAGQFMCVSFHATKILGDTQGGAILHDDPEADRWLRRARFDGRAEGVAPKHDKDIIMGWHCYMSPDVAARLMHKLMVLPRHNDPLPNDDYPDLATLEAFK